MSSPTVWPEMLQSQGGQLDMLSRLIRWCEKQLEQQEQSVRKLRKKQGSLRDSWMSPQYKEGHCDGNCHEGSMEEFRTNVTWILTSLQALLQLEICLTF